MSVSATLPSLRRRPSDDQATAPGCWSTVPPAKARTRPRSREAVLENRAHFLCAARRRPPAARPCRRRGRGPLVPPAGSPHKKRECRHLGRLRAGPLRGGALAAWSVAPLPVCLPCLASRGADRLTFACAAPGRPVWKSKDGAVVAESARPLMRDRHGGDAGAQDEARGFDRGLPRFVLSRRLPDARTVLGVHVGDLARRPIDAPGRPFRLLLGAKLREHATCAELTSEYPRAAPRRWRAGH